MEHTSSQIKTLYMDGDSNLSELDIHGKLFKFCISEIQQHWHKNCDSRSVRIELFKMCAELKADLSDGKEARYYVLKIDKNNVLWNRTKKFTN